MVQTKIFSPDCIAINECGLHYSLARAGETADSPLVWERTRPFLQFDVLSTGHVKQTHPPMPGGPCALLYRHYCRLQAVAETIL